jgi:catechol 2,3-dioxygenase-like lactoylglutathione lyase family enzyme
MVERVRVCHLALAVQDEERSRRFYERHLGFGARPPRRYPDGVLMLYDPEGFALALGPAEGPPQLPRFLHFGFAMPDRTAVLPGERLKADGVQILEEWDEPHYCSVKCRDPDGYVIEAFWEVLP